LEDPDKFKRHSSERVKQELGSLVLGEWRLFYVGRFKAANQAKQRITELEQELVNAREKVAE